jgi:hypothetical protein
VQQTLAPRLQARHARARPQEQRVHASSLPNANVDRGPRGHSKGDWGMLTRDGRAATECGINANGAAQTAAQRNPAES